MASPKARSPVSPRGLPLGLASPVKGVPHLRQNRSLASLAAPQPEQRSGSPPVFLLRFLLIAAIRVAVSVALAWERAIIYGRHRRMGKGVNDLDTCTTRKRLHAIV